MPDNPRSVGKKSNIKLIGLGEDIFTERMREAKVDNLNGLKKVDTILNFAKKIKLNILAAKLIIFLKGWTPLIITIEKL